MQITNANTDFKIGRFVVTTTNKSKKTIFGGIKMGLKLADLIGKLKSVEIVGMSQAEKDNKQIVVLKVSDGEKEYDIGLFGQDVAEQVLEKHGRKDGAKTLLDIPASKLKEEGIMWINNPY